MSNLLAYGIGWVARKLIAHASRPIVYRRGANEVAVNAVVGRTLLKLDDDYGGVRVEWTGRDFWVVADDLVLGGQKTLPQRGDQILENEDGRTVIYEVLAPCDEPDHVMIRIHAKRAD